MTSGRAHHNSLLDRSENSASTCWSMRPYSSVCILRPSPISPHQLSTSQNTEVVKIWQRYREYSTLFGCLYFHLKHSDSIHLIQVSVLFLQTLLHPPKCAHFPQAHTFISFIWFHIKHCMFFFFPLTKLRTSQGEKQCLFSSQCISFRLAKCLVNTYLLQGWLHKTMINNGNICWAFAVCLLPLYMLLV